MARAFGTTLFLLVAFLIPGCDSAADHEACVDSRECLRSTFSRQDKRARDAVGILWRGQDLVAGAAVRVTPSPESATGRDAPPIDTTTDTAGFYRAPTGSSRYDLLFKMPGGATGADDLLVYRGVAFHYFEPNIDAQTKTPTRAWSAKVDLRFDPPLSPQEAVHVMASGDGVYGVVGDRATGFTIQTARYSAKATVHAIAYDPALGLNSASAYGRTDVFADAAVARAVTLHLEPITAERTAPTFEPSVPPGFVVTTADVWISVSRTSTALLASIPSGTVTTLAAIPNVDYMLELRATRADGAVSSTGEINFDRGGTTKMELVAPPTVGEPADGATLGAGDVLGVGGSGVAEHVFEPTTAGRSRLQIVQPGAAETTFPDARAANATTLTGAYTWTVRRYPTISTVEGLWGPDSRRFKPFSLSAPRKITLR